MLALQIFSLSVFRYFYFFTTFFVVEFNQTKGKQKKMSSNQRPDFFQIVDPAQKEAARREILKFQPRIIYSEKYYDNEGYEYRHVILPRELKNYVPRSRLMEENEWRQVGVQQSVGWKHYMIHRPEPHVLLFKRPRTD